MKQIWQTVKPEDQQIVYWPTHNARPRRFFFLSAASILVIFFVLFFQIISSAPGDAGSGGSSIWQRIQSALFGASLIGPNEQDRDRLNFLLLGMGGQGHEGGTLTDTVIFTSVQLSSGKVAMISLPRDINVHMPEYGYRKLNAVYALNERDNPGSGAQETIDAVENIVGQPIDYYVAVDFDGFEQLIDELGGITIDVENTLDDYKYPVPGNEEAEDYEERFQHLHIDAGKQKMNGDLALKYARSRHAVGVEAGDFARAKRQQKVIQAVMDKVFSFSTFMSPQKLVGLINTYNQNVETDISATDIPGLYNLAKKADRDNIIREVLDDSPNGYLFANVVNGAYLLFPKTDGWKDVHRLAANIFDPAPPAPVDENPTVEIYNGTFIGGLAGQHATILENNGFTVNTIANANERPFEQTVIVQLNYDKPISLDFLKEHYPTAEVTPLLPGSMQRAHTSTDYIVIAGTDL